MTRLEYFWLSMVTVSISCDTARYRNMGDLRLVRPSVRRRRIFAKVVTVGDLYRPCLSSHIWPAKFGAPKILQENTNLIYKIRLGSESSDVSRPVLTTVVDEDFTTGWYSSS